MTESNSSPERQSAPLREQRTVARRPGSSRGDTVYGIGLIGALVYYWQDANSFWQYVLAILKSLVWPALLIYDALGALHR